MTVFDWSKVRPSLLGEVKSREYLIRHAFEQYTKGNDCYDDADRQQLDAMWDCFRAAWIISEESI